MLEFLSSVSFQNSGLSKCGWKNFNATTYLVQAINLLLVKTFFQTGVSTIKICAQIKVELQQIAFFV